MANFIYVNATGLVIPDTAAVRQEVEQEYLAIFGEDFVVDPETPEGALITAEVTSRQSVVRNNAQVANQINPNIAGGPFLDAVWALTGGSRDRATNSTVQLVCNGVAGVSIPQGSRAADDQGNNWISTVDLIIGTNGTITGSFRAENTGPVAASANTITNIVDSVLGWETVNNPTAATLGRNVQSDVSARRERVGQLALLGRRTPLAIQSNLLTLNGVTSLSFLENVEDTQEVIQGITLRPHSIWVAVAGGADTDIATTIRRTKGDGVDTNGTTEITVTEEISGQPFVIRFQRPEDVEIRIRITARPGVTPDPQNQIIDSIINYASGQSPIGPGFTVGNDVSPYEIASAVNNDNNTVTVNNVEIALLAQSSNFSSAVLNIDIDQIAVIDRNNIEVVLV